MLVLTMLSVRDASGVFVQRVAGVPKVTDDVQQTNDANRLPTGATPYRLRPRRNQRRTANGRELRLPFPTTCYGWPKSPYGSRAPGQQAGGTPATALWRLGSRRFLFSSSASEHPPTTTHASSFQMNNITITLPTKSAFNPSDLLLGYQHVVLDPSKGGQPPLQERLHSGHPHTPLTQYLIKSSVR